MASADHLIELGPMAGTAGGLIVAEGTPRAVAKKKTATGARVEELVVGLNLWANRHCISWYAYWC